MTDKPTGLKRALNRWDLILYGVIVIQLTAPMPSFGVLSARANGHVATTILLAMIAMAFTAISYGRMAAAHPSAGSAFTYVTREFTPVLGYVTGWAMLMDYVLNPLISIIWCSRAAMNFAPDVPYAVWAIAFFALFTSVNLVGIKSSARISGALAATTGGVVLVFLVCAGLYVRHHNPGSPGFFTHPFYDPKTFRAGAVLNGTSIAVLTYIGFDGISTLSEEVEDPRRNILFATVGTCLVIGILSAIEVYAAQLVWPTALPFRNVDTAFVEVAARAAGPWLFVVMNLALLIAGIGSGVGSHLGAARLLYGMGRSNALPPEFFGAVDPKHRIPRNNVILVGLIALCGAFLISYGLGAEILNFGALFAYMGVNAAALARYYVRSRERRLRDFWPPAAGFVTCLILWIYLSNAAKLVGASWMIVGVIVGAVRTRGFRRDVLRFEVSPED
ncbi:MAG TPA: APC family permease [Steroidobacteraceae bacterium]|nr:APC family permease [Steroidobacteraceae bacterium]